MRLQVTENSVNSELTNRVSYSLHKNKVLLGGYSSSVLLPEIRSFPLPKFQAERGGGSGSP